MGVNGDGEDWSVDCSDDEKYTYEGGPKGIWMPATEEIRTMFEKLDRGEILELKWKCPGRRKPDDESTQDTDATQEPMQIVVEKPKKQKPAVPDEFDFDDFGDDQPGKVTPITPRRTPGSKTPKSTKRVARMDKVLDDIMRQRKILAAEKQARRLALQSSSPRGSLSNQHSPRPAGTNQPSPRHSGPNSPIRSHIGTGQTNLTVPDKVTLVTSSTSPSETPSPSNPTGTSVQGHTPQGFHTVQSQMSDGMQGISQSFPSISLHGLTLPGMGFPKMTVPGLNVSSHVTTTEHSPNQSSAQITVQSPITKPDSTVQSSVPKSDNSMDLKSNVSTTTVSESCNTEYDFPADDF